MKIILPLFVVFLSLSAYAGNSELDQWIRPLVGIQHLKGTAGCDYIEIRDTGSFYDVRIGGGPAGAYIVSDGNIRITQNSLRYNRQTSSGTLGCNEMQLDIVSMDVDNSGNLQGLKIVSKLGHGCVVPPWGWQIPSSSDCHR
jgi:hypothetical protein